MNIEKFVDYKNKVIKSCNKVIIGKDDIIELILVCFVCSGHVLLEDLPGTGKTMLLRSFSKTIGGDFKRIQFTPDLLPSDLTGINFYNQKTGDFQFRKGPLFANIVLADEINRATPRTQSSLLEAMEEKQISIDGQTHKLDEPFMVMATQNPIESFGTFPLPEAQTDRFLMKLKLGYMNPQDEINVISRKSTIDILETLTCVVTDDDTKYIKENYHNIKVSDDVKNYLMSIITKTRNTDSIITGVSTRGAIALYQASQVMAAFLGRDFVIPEDIKKLAPYVLSHRITLSGRIQALDSFEIINKLVAEVPVPVEDL